MPTSNLDTDGYELFPPDRKKVGQKPVGGCALYISDNVNFDEKLDLIPQNLEGICGVVTFPNKHRIIVAYLYKPPNEKINWFDKIYKIQYNFSDTKLEFIINGDLNSDLLKQPLKNHTKQFVHTCELPSRLVIKPTRVTPTSRTLIDVIMRALVEHDVISGGIADHHLVYSVNSDKSHAPT